MTGFVSFVGAGPGDPELLTVKAVRRIEQADAILFDDLANRVATDSAREGVKLVPVGKRAGRPSPSQAEVNRVLVEHAKAGMRVDQLADAAAEILEPGSEGFAAVARDEDPTGLRYREMRGDESRGDTESNTDRGGLDPADTRPRGEQSIDDRVARDVTVGGGNPFAEEIGLSAFGRIEYQVHPAILQFVDHMRPAFEDLVDAFDRQPGRAQIGRILQPADPRLGAGCGQRQSQQGQRAWLGHFVVVEHDGGGNLQVRLGQVTFGEEEIEGVVVACGQTQGVQVDTGAGSAVDAAQVDDQLVVDENPDVVVTGEAEGLPGLVGEHRRQLHREMVVVDVALVAPALAVDGEVRRTRVLVNARTRERLGQGEVLADGLIHAGGVVVPLVEIGSVGEHDGRGGEHRGGEHEAGREAGRGGEHEVRRGITAGRHRSAKC